MTDLSINATDLKSFPRPVAKIITEAVNKHGVAYRFQDGMHIRLYCGDRKVVPIKVAAQRPAEHTVRYLIPWLEEHIDSWTKDEKMESTRMEALAEVLNSEPKPVRAKAIVDSPAESSSTGEQDSDTQWVPWKYGLETNGTDYRCPVKGCTYYRAGNAQGAHLHQQVHNGTASTLGKRGGDARALKVQQHRVMRQEAVRVLAKQNGLEVVEKGTAKDAKEVEKLKAHVEKLTKERDDLQARVDLMSEAFKGLA